MAQVSTAEAGVEAQPPGGVELEEGEEYWPIPSLFTEHTVHTIHLASGGGNPGDNGNGKPRILRYKSLPTRSDEKNVLTPLDMIMGSDNEDELYDGGTGNLLWLAAVCFGHLVAQEVEPLRSYLWGKESGETPHQLPEGPAQTRRFCELGCGTGGAGISLLLCRPSESEEKGVGTNPSCHVVFTDNDPESLELCASNCELNDLDPETHSQEILYWGADHWEEQIEPKPLQSHTFDVVLATDVIYDPTMMAPLFETVDLLLKNADDSTGSKGGYLVLSHVPRFCIPRIMGQRPDDEDEDETGYPRSSERPFAELEAFVCSEARKAGFVLAETIRPHEVLSEEGMLGGDKDNEDLDEASQCSSDNNSMQHLTLETIEEAHAVVFVFERA